MGRFKLPPEQDFKFYQKRKKDNWREVAAPEPTLEAPIADSHAHVQSLPDPAWELARCAANGVDLVCAIADPSDDDLQRVFSLLNLKEPTEAYLREAAATAAPACEAAPSQEAPLRKATLPQEAPEVLLALGVHPHNAELYTDELEAELERRLAHPAVRAVGEIGLDYWYDNSPRQAQRDVFRRQIRLAKRLGLPIALHLRSGKDAQADNAHAEAYAILQEEGFPEQGTLLHCCALPPDELQPWIDADCYIAYGGALTFKDADAAREGAKLVPADRLLFETDTPYMTPEPMRGTTCTPAHVIFTAERIADIRGLTPGAEREAFLRQTRANTAEFYRAR